MACFLVPMTEAIVVSVIRSAVKKKGKKSMIEGTVPKVSGAKSQAESEHTLQTKISWSRKLGWLTNLLWGGVLLLAFEHLWHGEVVPWFPFLTAASSPGDTATMLHEMSTVGVSMAIFVTAVWICMVLISNAMAKKVLKEEAAAKSGETL